MSLNVPFIPLKSLGKRSDDDNDDDNDDNNDDNDDDDNEIGAAVDDEEREHNAVKVKDEKKVKLSSTAISTPRRRNELTVDTLRLYFFMPAIHVAGKFGYSSRYGVGVALVFFRKK